MESFPKRYHAVKVSISRILSGTLQHDSPSEPLYLLSSGEKLYRLNLMTAILSIDQIGSITNIIIDDGSGKLIVRLFEGHKSIALLIIGKCILIIGKARIYNNEKYISPEILKVISPLWLKLRSLEIQQEKIMYTKITAPEQVIEEVVATSSSPFLIITKLIKQLDQGEGVHIEDIIEKSTVKETEQLLTLMLEKGDIFQITPGRVKVL